MTNPLAPSKDHTWRCPGNLDPRHTTYSYTYWPSGAIRSYRNGTGATRNYSYDHDRNRLTATAPNGTAHTYAYRPDDAIATDTPTGLAARTFSYDDNGRLTGDGCSSYDYDGFDRTAAIYPASTPSAGCTVNTQVSKTKYDGLDRPAVSIHTDGITTTTTTLGYDLLGSALDTETDTGAVSGTTRYALDGGDNPVALKRTNNGTGGPATGVQQLTADGNGNIATITDSAGALVCDGRYDPYGQPDGNGSATITDACNTTATADTLGYNSVRTDSVSGNQQLGGRTYSPALGGFTTPDGYRAAPADANLGIGVDPLTRNTYGYVNGDPVNLTDPSGHMACDTDYNGQTYCNGTGAHFAQALAKRDRQEFVAHAQHQAAQLVVRQVMAYRNANFYFNTHNVSWDCSAVAPTLVDKCQQANAYGKWIGTLESLPATQLSPLDKWALRDWVSGPAAGGVTDDPWGNAIIATAATLGLLGPEEAATGASEGAIEQGGSRALSAASSRLLGQNLERAGFERGEDVAAHHIVAGGAARAAEARAVLARFGIDINSAENGVFLPADTASPNLEGAAVHATVHTAAYYETVNALLGEAVSREEALDVLSFVRNQLLSGGLPSMDELAGAGG